MNIYTYFDYRTLLKDAFALKKATDPTCTVRNIAQAAGYSTPSFWSKLTGGDLNITTDTALKLATFFNFKKPETKYFVALVHYNQAEKLEEKNFHLETMIDVQRINAKLLEPYTYELFKEWYYAAIHELSACVDISDNFDEIATMLRPQIRAGQVKKALLTLEKLGLLTKDDRGIYKKVDVVLSAGEDWKSVAIAQFQKKTLEMAIDSLENVSKEHRNMSTLTLSINSTTYKNMVEEIIAFRKKLLTIASQSDDPELVYQLNVAFFPLSDIDYRRSHK